MRTALSGSGACCLSPQTRIYSNLHPAMLHYREHYAASLNDTEGDDGKKDYGKKAPLKKDSGKEDPGKRETGKKDPAVTITIGRDAGWYHPELPNVQWISDVQPFGYGAVTALFNALGEAMRTGSRGGFSPEITLGEKDGVSRTVQEDRDAPGTEEKAEKTERAEKPERVEKPERAERPEMGERTEKRIRGFRRFTTPFAPDQSGAVSVLYDMGGISVVCDAGGCTGNICGFDEPAGLKSGALFSAPA